MQYSSSEYSGIAAAPRQAQVVQDLPRHRARTRNRSTDRVASLAVDQRYRQPGFHIVEQPRTFDVELKPTVDVPRSGLIHVESQVSHRYRDRHAITLHRTCILPATLRTHLS